MPAAEYTGWKGPAEQNDYQSRENGESESTVALTADPPDSSLIVDAALVARDGTEARWPVLG
jgi:hypothetical protein